MALGQITPGPVVHTVAVVGYAAAGIGGGAARRAGRVRAVVRVRAAGRPPLRPAPGRRRVQAFLTGAGPAAIGAIGGSAVLLALAVPPVAAGRPRRGRPLAAGPPPGPGHRLLAGAALGITAALFGLTP